MKLEPSESFLLWQLPYHIFDSLLFSYLSLLLHCELFEDSISALLIFPFSVSNAMYSMSNAAWKKKWQHCIHGMHKLSRWIKSKGSDVGFELKYQRHHMLAVRPLV